MSKKRKHNHYFKDCPYPVIDPYRLLELFGVTSPSIAHAVKKLLVAGGRGSKAIGQDIQEAIDTLERWKQMRKEDEHAAKKMVSRRKTIHGGQLHDHTGGGNSGTP